MGLFTGLSDDTRTDFPQIGLRLRESAHQFWLIDLLEVNQEIQLTLKGRRLCKGVNTKRQGSLGGILEAAYLRSLVLNGLGLSHMKNIISLEHQLKV